MARGGLFTSVERDHSAIVDDDDDGPLILFKSKKEDARTHMRTLHEYMS